MSTRILRSGGLSRQAANMATLTAENSNISKTPVSLSEYVQMEEYDKFFNPRSPVKIVKNQCPDCGVKVGRGRLPCHSLMHTCHESYVCQLLDADGKDCHKPCLSKDKESEKTVKNLAFWYICLASFIFRTAIKRFKLIFRQFAWPRDLLKESKN